MKNISTKLKLKLNNNMFNKTLKKTKHGSKNYKKNLLIIKYRPIKCFKSLFRMK